MTKKVNLNELRNLIRQVLNEGMDTPVSNKNYEDFKEWLGKLPQRGENDIEVDNFEFIYPNNHETSDNMEFHLIGNLEVWNDTIRFTPSNNFKVSRVFKDDSKLHDISEFGYTVEKLIFKNYKETFFVNPGEEIYAHTSHFDKSGLPMQNDLLFQVYQEYYLPNMAK
jgi:hypothetical protein